MALQKTIIAASGLTVANAYIKVTCVSGAKGSANALVETFASKAAADADLARVDVPRQITVPIDPAAGSWDAQAYTYMKTLPAYSGATDC
jgi:hypothetical protein